MYSFNVKKTYNIDTDSHIYLTEVRFNLIYKWCFMFI